MLADKTRALPHAVYRLFGATDGLLYVGMSRQPDLRRQQHSYEKPWWPEVASHTVEWFDDWSSAARAEQSAIRAEVPRYNRMFHPDYPPKVEIPDNGVTLTEFRQRIVTITDRVEETGEVVFLYSHGKRVAALLPAGVGTKLDEFIKANGGYDEAVRVLRAARDS